MKRVYMDRFIDSIEWVAAAFVGIVAANIFIAGAAAQSLQLFDPRFLRFRPPAARHPDLLGHRRHLLSRHAHHRRSGLGNVGPRYQRMIDVFATLVLLFVVTVQTYTLFDKVTTARATTTFSPSTCGCRPGRSSRVAWLGDVSAVLLIAIRTYRLILQPETWSMRPKQ